MSKWLKEDGRPDFELLFAEARPQLLAVARRVVRNEADAEDVLQQAFVNALRAADRFEARAQATSWMYRIVYNTGLMHLRSKRRKGAESLDALAPEVGEAVVHRDRDDTADHDPAELVQRRRLSGVLDRAIETLSPVDQVIVRMRLIDEHSTKEVADATGLTPAATKTRLHRARRMLRDALDPAELGVSFA